MGDRRKVRLDNFEGEDRRVDVKKLEFELSDVIKIIIVVAIFVSTAVIYQLQIQSNTAKIEAMTNVPAIELKLESVAKDIDVIKKIQQHKIGEKEFETFKKEYDKFKLWVQKEI